MLFMESSVLRFGATGSSRRLYFTTLLRGVGTPDTRVDSEPRVAGGVVSGIYVGSFSFVLCGVL